MNKNGLSGLVIVCVVMLFAACKSQKMGVKKGFHNEIFGIEGLKCTETANPNAVDSKVANISCDDISLAYDYGLFSNPGPLTPEEEFTRAFDNYHHIRFFEDRLIDPKVYKIFLDSVKVVNVRRKSDSDKLMFPCDPCNTSAVLTFMGDTYIFPTTLSEKQLNEEGYSYSFEEKDDFIFKYYQREGELPGLYVAPKKNRYKTKNTLSLIVTESTLKTDEIMKILKSVYLIQ